MPRLLLIADRLDPGGAARQLTWLIGRLPASSVDLCVLGRDSKI